ncbi:hypothetical protein ACWKSP_32515 [Micromonosporaceae bacterium Da 78-11]
MTAALEDAIVRLLADGDADEVADALIRLDEPARHALIPLIRGTDPTPEDPTGDRSGPVLAAQRRAAALRVAGAACLRRPADIAAWLRSPRLRHAARDAGVAGVLRVLAVPGRPSLRAVALGLARRLRPGEITGDVWTLTAALLRAAGVAPPATEPVTRAWIRDLRSPDPGTLTARLADDPWLDHLIPYVFTTAGLPAHLDENWPPALLRLTTSGRLDRAGLIRLVLHRMQAGDRPGALRPVVELHRLLDPGMDERTTHRPDYLGMLTGPSLAVTEIAQQALRSLDDAGRLEPTAIAAAGRAVLARTEKKLVRAQLDWLAKALIRHPQAAGPLLEAVGTGLLNPGVDLAEQALRVLSGHPGGSAVLAGVDGLHGDLRRQADALLGVPTAVATATFAPARAPRPPEAMPAPIASVAELDELAAAFAAGLTDPVELERLLGAVAAFAHTEPHAVADALGALTLTEPPPSPLSEVLTARIRELAGQLATGVPPALLASPATVTGHVDPDRVLALLTEAEQDGRQPGPYDLAQALLRLPRQARAPGADRLVSPAGRRFAAWLRTGGLADPVITAVTPHGDPAHRVLTCTALDRPGLALPGLALPAELLAPAAGPLSGSAHSRAGVSAPPAPDSLEPVAATGPTTVLGRPDPGCWPMVLPSHREIVAAHLHPYLVAGHGLSVLPALARSSGPFGPAMALALAYGLPARRPQDRLAAVDAVLRLAGSGGLDAGLTGRELALLLTHQAVVLGRLVDALGEIARAGAQHVVWAIAHAVVPALLRLDHPPAGTPDLLALASGAAAATGAHADLPEVTATAARPGRSRLRAEAARLARTITPT